MESLGKSTIEIICTLLLIYVSTTSSTERMMCLRFANDGMIVLGEVGGVFGPHHMDHFLKSKKRLS
jgi:hypothetical protein